MYNESYYKKIEVQMENLCSVIISDNSILLLLNGCLNLEG